MEIDGPIFLLKSGYFLLIWVKVCLKKLAFSSFLSQLYDMKCCFFFQTRNPPFSLFLAFWLLYFHSFAQVLFERSLFH